MTIFQEASLARREPGIPGFPTVLDAAALSDLITESVPQAEIHDLSIDYLRYKPGMNCIARFGYSDGQLRTFGYAKAFSAGAASKLAKARDRQGQPTPAGPERIILDEQNILVCFLPNDNRLRSLHRLADPDGRRNLLGRLFKQYSGWEEARFVALTYKPERRFVARFTHPDGDESVVKFYSPREFDHFRKFRKRLRTPKGVRIPEWIGGSKAHQAIAFSWLPGSTLAPANPGNELDSVAAAGMAIAAFHTSPQPGLRPRPAGYNTRRVEALSRDLVHLLPELAVPARELADRVAAWLDAGDHGGGMPVHGDFHHRQVVIDGSSAALIDSDEARKGAPLADLGNFLAHLEESVIDGELPAGQIPALTRALCDGYEEIRTGQDFSGLNRHVAFHLFQLVHGPFRRRTPDWPSRTTAMLRRCADLFDS